MMNCPRCSNDFSEHPALSRRDNKTEICSQCGIDEAMEDFIEFQRKVFSEINKN